MWRFSAGSLFLSSSFIRSLRSREKERERGERKTWTCDGMRGKRPQFPDLACLWRPPPSCSLDPLRLVVVSRQQTDDAVPLSLFSAGFVRPFFGVCELDAIERTLRAGGRSAPHRRFTLAGVSHRERDLDVLPWLLSFCVCVARLRNTLLTVAIVDGRRTAAEAGVRIAQTGASNTVDRSVLFFDGVLGVNRRYLKTECHPNNATPVIGSRTRLSVSRLL